MSRRKRTHTAYDGLDAPVRYYTWGPTTPKDYYGIRCFDGIARSISVEVPTNHTRKGTQIERRLV